MENFLDQANTSGSQLQTDSISERKSRFSQTEKQHIIHRPEVICPQPRRLTSVHCNTDRLNRVDSVPKRVESGCDIFDYILTKNDPEGDLELDSQRSFFCGSPPLRTNNPIIQDPHFAELSQETQCVSPLAISLGIKQGSRVGSPSCGSSVGGSPKTRIEGFSCGSPESPCIVPALA